MEPNAKKAPPSPQLDNDGESGDAKLVCAMPNELVEKILWCVKLDHEKALEKKEKEHQGKVDAMVARHKSELKEECEKLEKQYDSLHVYYFREIDKLQQQANDYKAALDSGQLGRYPVIADFLVRTAIVLIFVVAAYELWLAWMDVFGINAYFWL